VNVALLAVLAIVIAAATAMFWPLRVARAARRHEVDDRFALEIARDAKLGELHDLQLDFRLGKLSAEDYRALNATLRSEAVEAIRRVDATATNGRRR
jgi:hypothetical protein